MNKTKQVWEKVSAMNIKATFTLGPINAESLIRDPKHLAFTLSRYKFAAKMLKECKHIIEIGCGEGIGVFTFLSETGADITAIDFDENQIKYATEYVLPLTNGRARFLCKDMIASPYKGRKADGLVCIDVIEHIHHRQEEDFFYNTVSCLKKGGIAVLGTPNKHADKYASARSRQGHINTFTPERLSSALKGYFSHVFLFSMNDEMVHTGFYNMAHYLIALCIR